MAEDRLDLVAGVGEGGFEFLLAKGGAGFSGDEFREVPEQFRLLRPLENFGDPGGDLLRIHALFLGAQALPARVAPLARFDPAQDVVVGRKVFFGQFRAEVIATAGQRGRVEEAHPRAIAEKIG